MRNIEKKVSVVIPAYNAAEFIEETIQSLLQQTYRNWEAIFVDDASKDETLSIVKRYAASDPRIRWHAFEMNQGAALARNKGVETAEGSYIAFLDSDDVWYPDKLTRQVQFMERNGWPFTCTQFEKIDASGKPMNRVITPEAVSGYEGVLKKCPGNSTVMYDADQLGKFYIPDIRKRNDYVMWLQVIKKAKTLHGLQETLSAHRERTGSLSSRKSDLVKYQWMVYRDIEKLSLPKSLYLLADKVVRVVLKKG